MEFARQKFGYDGGFKLHECVELRPWKVPVALADLRGLSKLQAEISDLPLGGQHIAGSESSVLTNLVKRAYPKLRT